jgi:hypothetical protein
VYEFVMTDELKRSLLEAEVNHNKAFGGSQFPSVPSLFAIKPKEAKDAGKDDRQYGTISHNVRIHSYPCFFFFGCELTSFVLFCSAGAQLVDSSSSNLGGSAGSAEAGTAYHLEAALWSL